MESLFILCRGLFHGCKLLLQLAILRNRWESNSEKHRHDRHRASENENLATGNSPSSMRNSKSAVHVKSP
jgi:hypothetical protein